MNSVCCLADSLSSPTPYEVLGVAKDASLREIRSKYLKSVLQCHPDRVKDDAVKEQRMHEFHQVQWAYDILGDETMRRLYDERRYFAELRAMPPERRKSARSLRVIPHTSQRLASEYHPQCRDMQYDGPLPPPLATQTTSSTCKYHEEIPPLLQSQPRPPVRRLSVWEDRKPAPFLLKAPKTAHHKMATAALSGTSKAP